MSDHTTEIVGDYKVTKYSSGGEVLELNRQPTEAMTRNDEICAELAAMEKAMGMSRAMREQFVLMGATDFIVEQDKKAQALRAKLEK